MQDTRPGHRAQGTGHRTQDTGHRTQDPGTVLLHFLHLPHQAVNAAAYPFPVVGPGGRFTSRCGSEANKAKQSKAKQSKAVNAAFSLASLQPCGRERSIFAIEK